MTNVDNAAVIQNSRERWNYSVLLGHATAEAYGWHLAGPSLVLPFIYVAMGGPVLFAALLLPLLQAAQLISGVVSTPYLSAQGNSKLYLAASRIMMTVALVLIALAAEGASPIMLVVVFLAAATIFGASEGFGNLAYKNLVGSALRSPQRSALVFNEMLLAGAIAVGVAWGSRYVFDFADPLHSHVFMLWAGTVGFGLAGLVAILIHESRSASSPVPDEKPGSPTPQETVGYVQQLRRGFLAVSTMPWFKRYLVTRFLLLSVELATPFYAIQAALLHKSKVGSLSLMVIASGVSFAVAGPVWRFVSARSNRAVMGLGAALAAGAGLLAIGIDEFPWAQSPYAHAAVIFIVMISIAGIGEARNLYIMDAAPEAERPYCFSLAGAAARLGGVLVSLAFGYLAHIQHVIWPIYILVALNVVAALSVFWLAPPKKMATEAASSG